MNRIRLILLDDHGLFRTSVGHFLASEPDFEWWVYAARPLRLWKSSPVRRWGTEEGTAFIANARRAGFNGRFLIVTRAADMRNSALVLKLGASGIFLKSDAPDRLLQAIRAVANGEIWVDQRVIHLLAHQLIERDPGRP